jgi:hypothetical protein
MSANPVYLIEIDSQEREHEATVRLLDTDPVIQGLFWELGLQWPLCWCLVEIDQRQLVPERRGDVDILAGNLTWREPERYRSLVREFANEYPHWNPTLHYELAMWKLIGEGGILWPPRLDHVVAIEVKCAYLADNVVHSTKSSPSKIRGIRNQLDGLIEMGFDNVALLDFIATQPSVGMNGDAWLRANVVTAVALEQMHEILLQRLKDDSPASHFAICIGAVEGDSESMRGAGQLVAVRRNAERMKKSAPVPAALKMKGSLNELLENALPPPIVPYTPQLSRHFRRPLPASLVTPFSPE